MNGRERRRQNLRRRFLSWREQLPPSEVARRSEAVTERVLSWLEKEKVGSLCTYVAFRGEVETLPLIVQALQRGIRVAAPRVISGRALELCEIRSPHQDLQRGAWGIPEPAEGLPTVDLVDMDAILLPGLAFDVRGNRLGYGQGYYDRMLRRLPPSVRTAGLCYWEQVLSKLPHQPWDVPVQWIFSDRAQVKACFGRDRSATARKTLV